MLPEGKRKIRLSLLGFATPLGWAIAKQFFPNLDDNFLYLALSFLGGYVTLEGTADVVERARTDLRKKN